MGMDVALKARPASPMTEQQFTDLRRRFVEAMPVEDDDVDEPAPWLEWDRTEPEPTIDVFTLQRYYSPTYSRGHWPTIRAMGDWMVANLPDAEVRYGSDSADEWDYLTPWAERRAECEEHWNRVQNQPYDEFMGRSR